MTAANMAANSFIEGSDQYVEQWNRYLMVLVTAIQEPLSPNFRPSKNTKPANLLREVLRLTLPFLQTERTLVRNGVSAAVGKCHWTLFHVAFENLKPVIDTVLEDMKTIRGGKISSSRRSKKQDLLRMELLEMLNGLSGVPKEHEVYREDQYLAYYLLVIREYRDFLYFMETSLLSDWDFVILKQRFCQLVKNYYENFRALKLSSKFFPFDLRIVLFADMEEWCGHGQHRNSTR